MPKRRAKRMASEDTRLEASYEQLPDGKKYYFRDDTARSDLAVLNALGLSVVNGEVCQTYDDGT